MNSKYPINLKRLLIYLTIATVFLLLFSNGTSPLSKYYGKDSTFYFFVGKAMKYGKLPYKDLFEHKGPYYLLLQMISQYVCEGRVGIFILQIVNIFVCLIIIEKILIKVFRNIESKQIFCIDLIILFILAVLLREGNFTEEFCLPLLLATLYIYVDYFVNNSKTKFDIKNGFILGLFFSIIALIRLNNTVLICTVVLTVMISLIKNKEYKNLLHNMLSFVLGMCVGTIPALIYCLKNEILLDTINTVFIFAFKYATNISLIERLKNLLTLENLSYMIVIFYPMFVALLSKNNRTDKILFSSIMSISTFMAIFIGRNYLHYYILAIPNLVYAIVLIILEKDSMKSFIKNKIILLVTGLIILAQLFCFAGVTAKNFLQILDYSVSEKKRNYYSDIYAEYREVTRDIPISEKDKIWLWGESAKFYFLSETYPCIKYFDYLKQYTSYEDLRNEMLELLDDKKPIWIIVNKSVTVPDYIESVLSKYNHYYETTNFVLYRYK